MPLNLKRCKRHDMAAGYPFLGKSGEGPARRDKGQNDTACVVLSRNVEQPENDLTAGRAAKKNYLFFLAENRILFNFSIEGFTGDIKNLGGVNLMIIGLLINLFDIQAFNLIQSHLGLRQ
jgi:hypothetical protein